VGNQTLVFHPENFRNKYYGKIPPFGCKMLVRIGPTQKMPVDRQTLPDFKKTQTIPPPDQKFQLRETGAGRPREAAGTWNCVDP
jgi:hypothetical protein